ncbi:MAG: hypothetical protein ACREYE_02690, partial [Gammaproteobacteria bacterium]
PHVSSGVRSAGCNLIATRVFGMSETIAITGKSVKLFKGHYTRVIADPYHAYHLNVLWDYHSHVSD